MIGANLWLDGVTYGRRTSIRMAASECRSANTVGPLSACSA